MVSPLVALTPKVQSAIATALGDDFREVDPVLRPSQFADVQVNAALALAKKVGAPPREVAAKIVGALDLDGVCDSVEVSGPGFINLTFSSDWLASLLQDVEADPRLGVPLEQTENIPIDYSAPNVAKEMHVGHLRTTIVGDSLARTLEHLGHNVVRQNHIGDWGTPFGMLIEHLLEVGEDSDEAGLLVTDPNAFYQAARTKFDTAEKADPAGSAGDFNVRSRNRVVKLQAGDPETLQHWHELVGMSKVYFNKVYSTLGVTLTDDDLAGESMYNDELKDICDELEAKGIATVSDGALCVFLEGYTGREGKPVPLIIRKSDGGYNYGTSDLATIKHRVQDLKATGPSTSSARPSRCTSTWSGTPPARPAGCPTTSRRCTCRSATSWVRTARSCGRGRARRCASWRCSTRLSTRRGHSSTPTVPTSTSRRGPRSPGRSASGPSSTPTCRWRTTPSTSSTSTGCCR